MGTNQISYLTIAFVVLLLILVNAAYCKKVLVATVPTMSRSEYEPFLLIAQELQKQSDVEVYFAGSQNLASLFQPSSNFVSYGISAEKVSNATSSIYSLIQSHIDSQGLSSSNIVKETGAWSSLLYLKFYESSFKNLKKFFMKHTSATSGIDVVVAHPAALAARDLAAMFSVPAICIPTSLSALPNQPYYIPSTGSGVGMDTSMWQRLRVVFSMLFTMNAEEQEHSGATNVMEKVRQTRKKVMSEDSDAMSMLEKTPPLSLILYPTFYNVEFTFPVDTFIRYIGPIIKEAPQTIESSKKKYQIIVNFASSCVTHDLKVYTELATALEELKKSIVVALPTYCNSTSVEKVKQLFAEKFELVTIQNQDEEHSLFSDETKLVISYGDFSTVHMSLYHSVPLLLIPLHFDHFDMAARIQEKKLGIVIKVAENPTREFGSVPLSEVFKAHANRLISSMNSMSSSAFSSSASSASSTVAIPRAVHAASKAFKVYKGLKRSIEAVSETLELGSNDHLTPTWYALPSYRIYNLDIVAVCFGLPTLFTMVFFCIFGYKYLQTSGYLDKVKKD